MKPRRSLARTLAFVAVATLWVAGCGDGSTASRSPSAGVSADRAFVAHMVPHHESALEMAQLAEHRATNAFVKQLAGGIARTQSAEILAMRTADQRLQRAGIAKGSLDVPEHMMGMDGEVSALKSAKRFDRAFLAMMIPHHEGAIVMAKAELAKGKDPELRDLARRIMAAQQREIAQMRAELRRPPSSGSAGGGAIHKTGHAG